ncbi:FkbM family methyltransferase [Lutimaribacter sp. EGI FJ00015]|uniref:FkbM family methyltransferase n=1 Tax=Lutimaribacter degradans TaxID=2945989 RepID=A0ACC5ZVB2_9RHOB|nr:FkbM family methyltransferase [Lutimaribacter sp. EGI FJ00013]MCM2561785.1 FkbM family methyltransferase [Lutimaribacter sp. EGI FJ00013]MCO0613182.1 FkbM family methyltransferase [Lutimaribacter sp. EGI FJ00015]MCO0635618.1 FkbM family methyltransferase [Lutimaribacter sp. EGI FJ00014]
MSLKTLRRALWLRLQEIRGRELAHFAPHGVPVSVPRGVDDALTYMLAKGRPYEDEEAGMVKAHLQPGTPVIELGGCLGVVSALVRSRIGAEAPHIVVEANARLIPTLTGNATQGAAEGRAQVINAAVDYSGAQTIAFETGENAHVGRIGGNGGTRVEVPTVTLADLAERLGSDRFALICDIEGAELALFEHERADVLARIELLVLETHPKFYDRGAQRKAELMARLAELGLHVVEEKNDVLCLKPGS